MTSAPVRTGDGPGTIYLTAADRGRLQALVDGYRGQGRHDEGALRQLEDELDRAAVVDPGELPPDVVTLDAQVALTDRDTGEELLFSVVLPSRANVDEGRISVLAPLGMAVLGYRPGDDIEWEVPAGRRRLRVQRVTHPTPSAGSRR
jgi:regulator of nucleoside diphosphate kinase